MKLIVKNEGILYVTGIMGHSGKWFIERLKKEKYQGRIKCLVRPKSDTTSLDNSGLNIEKIVGDISNIELLKTSMVGIDTVLQIVSIKYSQIVMDIAIENNVKWGILVHTTGRYSKYKSASEEYIKMEDEILKYRSKIGVTILRPTMIYGSFRDRNMYKLIDYLYNHKIFPVFGNGRNLMQPVHAHDLGNAYYDVIVNRKNTFNKEYNLSGKYPEEYISIVKTISKSLHKKNILVKIPLAISIVSAKIYNMLCKTAIISEEQVLRMQEDKAFSHENARIDFGYSPCSFEEGIVEEAIEYLAK